MNESVTNVSFLNEFFIFCFDFFPAKFDFHPNRFRSVENRWYKKTKKNPNFFTKFNNISETFLVLMKFIEFVLERLCHLDCLSLAWLSLSKL